tara:strand:- start:168 stop:278 length:111 start_codon:yes stop_codon:yes gene_type:complete
MKAASAGRFEVCQELIQRGANIELKCNNGMTALNFA